MAVVYSREITDKVCSLIAEGLTLSEICRMPDMPGRSTFHAWLAANDDSLQDRYARAKADQIEVMADEIQAIADDATNDYMDRKISIQGRELEIRVLDAEHVQRSRLRIDARKWLLSKMKPEKYGDRLELAGEVNLTAGLAETIRERRAKRTDTPAIESTTIESSADSVQ